LTLIGSDDNALSCGKIARLLSSWGRIVRAAMSLDRQTRVLALGALALSAAILSCALSACSSPIADMPSLGSADASTKPRDAYLPVHDLPPERDEAVIPPDKRAKIESELIAARDRQASASAAQTPPAQTPPAQTPQVQDAAAQNTGAK
jgi:hypothetical protein